MTLPTDLTSILQLELPAGSYVVNATVAVDNPGLSRVPVLCVLAIPADSDGEPEETSVSSSVQLEPEIPETEGRASGATLPVSFATTLSEAGRIELFCQSNTGMGGATAQAEQAQMTAVTVADIVVQ